MTARGDPKKLKRRLEDAGVKVLDMMGATAVRHKAQFECVDCHQPCIKRIDHLFESQRCADCGKAKTVALNKERIIHHGVPRWFRYRWHYIQARCFDPLNKAYKDYGGRGITCCFASCSEMWVYVKELPDCDSKLTIDRIDNDKSYEIGNLRWIPKGDQVANRRKSERLKAANRLKAATGYCHQTIYRQLGEGLTEEDILTRYRSLIKVSAETDFTPAQIRYRQARGMTASQMIKEWKENND